VFSNRLRIASAALIVTVLATSTAYAGLLTNWFRYGVSLEAIFVLMPLALGTVTAAAVALNQSRRSLVTAALIAVGTCGVVLAAQLHAFGHLPSLSMNHVETSPVGRITIPLGVVEYWLELKYPFASGHSEYLLLRHNAAETRIAVPIFDVPAAGYASPLVAEDWGRLTLTSDPNVLELELGPMLIREGRFRIDLRTRHVERIL